MSQEPPFPHFKPVASELSAVNVCQSVQTHNLASPVSKVNKSHLVVNGLDPQVTLIFILQVTGFTSTGMGVTPSIELVPIIVGILFSSLLAFVII